MQTSGARGEGEGRPSILQCLTQDSLPRVMMSQPIYGDRLLCASVANSGQVLFSLPSKSGSILLIQLPLRAEGQWAGLAAPIPAFKCWSHPPPAGVGFHFEHHLSGVMQRLWSGLTRAGDAHQGEGLVLHSTQHSVTMALVTSELKLQCWGIKVCAVHHCTSHCPSHSHSPPTDPPTDPPCLTLPLPRPSLPEPTGPP